MNLKKLLIFVLFLLTFSFSLPAQSYLSVKVRLLDANNNEPVPFATVYVSKDGTTKNAFYSLTDEQGYATIPKVKSGTYIFKAELLGYKIFTKEVKIDASIDLGVFKIEPNIDQIEQSVVSAVGNPIVVKKDTIEYNASSFKTTDNDMLEELLKKLPGVEISSDGTITANGKTITKITIDGKTFFLDDPQLATKNIPAKIVQKVKVVEKKSEQAEFTGIDDGNEETIIDLSVIPGMMKGWFGNVSAGAGHDLVSSDHSVRYQASGMAGRFTDKSQLSFIGNGNNTNNRGFQDMAGEMMNSMRSSTGRSSGGGGMMGRSMGGNTSGITTSWMGGVNANSYFLDNNAMELGGNYLYNGSIKELNEKSSKTTFIDDKQSLLTTNNGLSINTTEGHRAGVELDYKITDKTSIYFRPQFNYGYSSYMDSTLFSSDNTLTGKVNDGHSRATGQNVSWKTNGRLLLRQKIGNTSGRTISLNIDYDISKNSLFGTNESVTRKYINDILEDSTVVDQQFKQGKDAYSIGGNLTYTEPLGKNYFLQASYKYSYNQNNSEKLTYDKDIASGDYSLLDENYSSRYQNSFINQNIQLNAMKQEDKYNVQVGFSAQPSTTKSVSHLFKQNRDSVLTYSVWNFAPSARFDYRFNDYKFLRINYRGSTQQPSITQLQPVPDNSNPLYISLGNPSLQPEFSHSVRGMYRTTDMKTFSSFSTMLNFSYTKDAIITASWYNKSGVQYSAPINSEEGSYSGSAMIMYSTPIAKSKFSINSFTRLSTSSKLTYSGTGEGQTLEEIKGELIKSRTTSLGASENLTFIYRDNYIEARLGGVASYSNAWYSVGEKKNAATWTNAVTGEINATMPWGMEIKTDARYNFYIGYDQGFGDPQVIWNAEISQLIFKKRATLRFKVYDILNQAKNNYRITTDNYVQDVVNNTLGQYFMISLTFRFGNFNNMAKGMNSGRGPHGSAGPPMGAPPIM